MIGLALLCGCASHNMSNFQGPAAPHGGYSSNFNQVLYSAQEGNAASQYELGYLYYNGIGVRQNSNRARSWFYRSATKGNRQAREALNEIKRFRKRPNP